MISLDVPIALRTRALAVEVLRVTGTFSTVTATGYARASGSFLTDGFEVGMEIRGEDFDTPANEAPKVIMDVSALLITTRRINVSAEGDRTLDPTASGCVTEAVGTRTLVVGMPAGVEYENARFKPGAGVPWWREEFSPSPGGRRHEVGSNSMVEYFVDYFMTLFLPPNTGVRAAHRYSEALLDAFPPGYTFTLAVPGKLRIRTEATPWPSPVFQAATPEPGFLVVPVTVPCILWTSNSI